MRILLDCIPCFVRQAIEAARFVTDDVEVHQRILRHVLRVAAELDLNRSPPEVGQLIHRRVREVAGVEDPYRERKSDFNRLALALLPGLVARVADAPEPLLASARLAIAANVIDLGAVGDLTEAEARDAVERSLAEPFVGDWEAFLGAAAEATDILYLADNAGEIVIDRLLIDALGPERVTLAVRGHAVINDATRADAHEAGLTDLVEVIDNGSDAPGTILEDCSPSFRERFQRADLVIAKGQGNFESLSDVEGDIFFLFKVKCPVIASHVGLETGTHALLRSNGT